MASVFEHRSRWYLSFQTPAGRRKRACPKGWTKRQAEAEAHRLERAAQEGEVATAQAERMTLGELCSWWLTTWCKEASRGREESRLRVHVIEQRLGEVPLKNVTAEAIEARLRALEAEGAAQATVEHVRRTLRTVFNRARRSRLWTRNPVEDVPARSMDSSRARETLAAAEVPRVLQAIEDPWKRDFAAFALYTAMRKGELLALRRADVDLERRSINIARSHGRQTTKGGHADEIPIAEPAVPFVEHALDASEGGELVFPGADGERREHLDAVAIVRTALKRAGIVEGYEHGCRRCKAKGTPHVERHADSADRRCPRCDMLLWPRAIPKAVTFHGLRHTTATLLLRAGVDPHRVQRILRHRDVRTTTKTYAHLLTEDLRPALDALPAAATSGPAPAAKGRAERMVAGAGARVPVLSPLARPVKSGGPDTEAENAVASGPSKLRAVQDSNLWPSAPEAGRPTSQGPADIGNPAQFLAPVLDGDAPPAQPDAGSCRPRVPVLSPPALLPLDGDLFRNAARAVADRAARAGAALDDIEAVLARGVVQAAALRAQESLR